MSKSIDMSEVEKAVSDILEEFGDKAQEVIAQSLEQVGKDTASELQNTSPKRPGGGDYAKGWKYQNDTRKKNKGGHKMTVYNEKHYYLTHLLENGHAKVNGGRVEGIPHIAPAQDKAEKEVIELITKGIERL